MKELSIRIAIDLRFCFESPTRSCRTLSFRRDGSIEDDPLRVLASQVGLHCEGSADERDSCEVVCGSLKLSFRQVLVSPNRTTRIANGLAVFPLQPKVPTSYEFEIAR